MSQEENRSIVPFTFEQTGQQVRTVIIDGEPWWVAKDVCIILGLGNSRMVTSRLKEKQTRVIPIYTNAGNRDFTIVNESGLYKIMMRSDKPIAEAFQDWIAEDVLPQIRKTGQYAVKRDNLEVLLEQVKELIAVRDRVRQAELEVADHEDRIQAIEAETKSTVGYLTITAFVSNYRVKLPKDVSFGLLGKAMTQFCHENDIEIRQRPHDKYGNVNTYPISALVEGFREMGLTVEIDLSDIDE